jgi:5-methylcytosine-specific restriction endonuclease McrA
MTARGLGSSYTGYKWCRKSTRWAIYWRDRDRALDALRCVWCNLKGSIADAAQGRFRLSLDHLDPWSAGGSNDPTNRVTACLKCNARRGKESFEETAITERYGVQVFRRVNRLRALPLDRARGRELASSTPAHFWRHPALVRERELLEFFHKFPPPIVDGAYEIA